MDDGADYRQQQELDEFEQYIAEQVKWINEQIKWFDENEYKFKEIFGVKNESS